MKKIVVSFLFSLFFIALLKSNTDVDIVIYSYHRPMQLYTLLESIHCHMSGYNTIHVIYRADSQEFEEAYSLVENDFSKTFFYKQSKNPVADFKLLTLEVFNKKASYIMFAVDDIIVKDSVDLQECVQALQKTKAFGFYLRLGTNLSYCYPTSTNQKVPPLKSIDNYVYSWDFYAAHYDWRLPFNVDMTLYAKKTISSLVTQLNYTTPNTLEAYSSNATRAVIREQSGICFLHSKIVNIPLNIIQRDYPANNNLNKYSINELLKLFQEGYIFDIQSVQGVMNHSAHADIPLKIIHRRSNGEHGL